MILSRIPHCLLMLWGLILFISAPLYAKPVELIFWHAMAGNLNEEVQALANDFNHQQVQYRVIPVYKGNYLETLTSFAAAFRAHQQPAMVQIFEVGTALMLSPKGVIKPVADIMEENHARLPEVDFIPSVKAFYSRDGRLMAMPFNLSAPILFYNEDALAKAGYTAKNFPKTWADMEVLAKRLQHKGSGCTYTSAYPGWILFESFMAIHGLQMTKDNGQQAAFATDKLLSHFQRMKRWYDARYFRYAGRVDDATILFTSGTCPLLSQSSGAYTGLKSIAPFRVGVARMPQDLNASATRYANVAGGAALWVSEGLTKEQYQGVAQFLMFLAKPKVQARWQERTGYLPLGFTGIYAGIIEQSHQRILKLAKDDLSAPLPVGFKVYLGPQNQIRMVVDDAFEAMFANLLSPRSALETAALRANHVLARFLKNTQSEIQK